ncbi:MAG: shikimate dehydrogenase [Deltaproteobacteria bacterium]|nr:shikimate dehydrogenase [Deltaproteobacteria bacterium]
MAVTIPHKGAALHFADRADEISRLVGAANTLIFGERTEAANTDVHGILTAFERSGVALAGLRLCVLGAGGAARAAVAAAHLGGASSVIVLARTLDRGRRLAEEFRGRTGLSIEARPYEGGSTAVADADGVINTTPLGLRGDDPLPLPSEALRRDLVVFDAIYRPARTTWLEAAQNAGAVAIPGTRMFLAQAAEQFRLLTGRAAPEDVMAKALTEIPGCDWL